MTKEIVPLNSTTTILPATSDLDVTRHVPDAVESAEMFGHCTACDELQTLISVVLTVEAELEWTIIILVS